MTKTQCGKFILIESGKRHVNFVVYLKNGKVYNDCFLTFLKLHNVEIIILMKIKMRSALDALRIILCKDYLFLFLVMQLKVPP